MKPIYKTLVLTILFNFIIISFLCNAQYRNGGGSIRSDITKQEYNQSTQLKRPKHINPGRKQDQGKQSFILYRNIHRRNLWLEGVGSPITQEEADKLPCYFRLSMKNNKGHYQFVEAMKNGQLTSDHLISPYIKDKKIISATDSVENLWDSRFATVGQWLITSDLAGDKVVEERAYEAKAENANLIYSFQPIYNDETHVTGSYTDSWGLPIDIDDNGDHYYGSVVYITLNQQGLDSIVDHIDAKGLCRYNEYGADQTRYLYDSKERVISVTSHNTVGDRINDNRGICGIIYRYNDDDDTCTVTHIDKNLKPVTLNVP